MNISYATQNIVTTHKFSLANVALKAVTLHFVRRKSAITWDSGLKQKQSFIIQMCVSAEKKRNHKQKHQQKHISGFYMV